MKSVLFLTCLTVSLCAMAGTGKMQADVLKKLPGALEDMHARLECLTAKSYPDDISVCGVTGFANSAHQKKLEDCLSSRRGKLVPLKVAPNGEYLTVLLVVPCPAIRVAAEFEVNAGTYSLVYIGELLD